MESFCKSIGVAKLAPGDRNEVLTALIPTETKLIVKQDKTVSELLYGNEFGSSMRQQMLAELNVLDQLDASQNNESMMSFVAMAAAGAAVGAQAQAASVGQLTPQLNQQAMNTIQQSTQLIETVSASEATFRTEVQNQLQAYTQRISSAQMVVVLNTSRGQFEIRGTGLSEIRAKIRAKVIQIFGLVSS